jgi:hypothetical protein
MRRLLLTLLLLPVLMGQSYNIPFNPQAAPAGAAWYSVSDDFNRSSSTDLGANWTETLPGGACCEIASDTRLDNTTNTGEVVWDAEGATGISALQCVCVQRLGDVHGYCGPKLRVPNLSGTGNSYAVRWQTDFDNVVVRECVGASCNTLSGGTWSRDIDIDDYLCACVDGTQADTEFAVWDRGTSDPTGEDPTDWGTPDYCVCESGSCSLWSSCDATGSGEPGSGNYQDCGSGCYLGLYSGAAGVCEYDNFSGIWYE